MMRVVDTIGFMTDNIYKRKMSLMGFVAPLVTVGLLFVFWRLGQKWVLIPAAAVLVVLYFLLPKIVRRLERQFHRKALMMLATGKASEVPEYASRQILLSLFGASAPVDAKLGLALSQLGRFQEAIECLVNAIPYAPQNELPALQTAYVKSLLVTGDAARAESEGRQILKNGASRLVEVLLLVARARIALGRGGPETSELIAEAEALKPDGDPGLMLRLTQIEYQLGHHRKPDTLENDVDSMQPFIRAWIHLVRGKLRENRGKMDDALTSYSRAAKLGKEDNCIFSEEARVRFERLSQMSATAGTLPQLPDGDRAAGADGDLDDVVRRKRRKRR